MGIANKTQDDYNQIMKMILQDKKRLGEFCRDNDIIYLGLFGSFARGEQKRGSDVDLLYKLKRGGFSVIEIPTIWESKDDSKIKIVKASLEMFLAVVRLRLIHSPFLFVVRAYDSLPQRLKVHHRIWK